MGRVNGAALLTRTLRQAGVETVFTLSGHQILPIYDAGLDAGLRFVDTRHESAAVHMADGWGRLTGRPGVCLVTAAPGHTNALTGIGTAWQAESPVLLLSGGTDLAHVGKRGFQEIDQLAVIRPICKAAWMATSAAALPALVARALRTAQAGVPGPVHITLPLDVLKATLDEEAAIVPSAAEHLPTPASAAPDAVGRAIALLREAARPVLLGSPSAWRGEAGERLRALLDLTDIPAFLVDSPIGLADPTFRGIGPELVRCDLALLVAPQDFAIGFAGPRTLGEDCRIVQVAPQADELGRNRAVDVGLVGDAASVLGQLLAAARAHTWPRSGWRAELEALQHERTAGLQHLEASDEAPVHPLRVAAAIRAALRAGDCVALDGGEFVRWARWALAGHPFEFLGNGKYGGLGPAIPLAMAAALARPGARSIACIGDGTFGFHGMELDTAVRHRLPIVVVVGNDAGWATERHRQREVYGPDRVVAADLLPTRYDQVAAALGAHGEYVERPDELAPALERAFASGGPACINVMVASAKSPAGAY